MSDGSAEVIVIGGGLAGIAAACGLLERGYSVTLVERRPFLGGRTYSVIDQHTGAEVDNGQHVFMQCCTAYIGLLKRLGVYDKTRLQKRLRVLVGSHDGRMAVLGASALPSPFHLLPSLIRFPYLSLLDKAQVVYGLAKIRRVKAEERQRLDNISFYDWLKANRQSEQAIRNFWNLVILPMLNDDVRLVSAAQALMVFQVGFLSAANAPNIGYSTVGLSSLLSQAAQRYIEAHGGRIIFGQKVERIVCESGHVVGIVLSNGQTLEGDYYVTAVPHQDLSALLQQDVLAITYFGNIIKLGSSPIVNVHLWYDRPVADFDFAAFLDDDVQWIFNKGAILGDTKAGYLDVSLSGARQHIDLPASEIANRVTAAVASILPKAKEARLLRHLVIKQHNATFAAAPGSGELRPSSQTPIANFFLAGDWTNTGWPATMEGAVQSGIACAQAIASIEISDKSDSVQSLKVVNFVT